MQDIGHGILMVLLYYAIAASPAFAGRFLFNIPNELFRKLLHCILLGSYIPFVFAFDTWWHAALLALVFEILVYPILKWFEHFKNYTAITTERKKGEFKSSLLLAFTMLALAISLCWGLMGDKYLVLACMYAWGVGDAFAALVGKRFGKHKIRLRHADPKKSIEGSAAMFISSAITVLVVLLFRGNLPGAAYIIIPLVSAAVATYVELITHGGMDTVTCPSAVMLVTIPLMFLFGGFA